MDNNGVIQKSKDARREYGQASENERKELSDLSEWIETAVGKIEYNEELKALKPGDYIIYDTGMEGVGEVTCRVLYDAESPYNLQIITDDCIKKNGEYVYIPFGRTVPTQSVYNGANFKEIFGEYDFSEWYNKYNDPDEMYNNAINILNNEAMKFCNNKYVADARCVGSSPENKSRETKETAKVPEGVVYGDGNTYKYKPGDDSELKDEDDNYEMDYNTLQRMNLLKTNKYYWLASRYNEIGPAYSHYDYLSFFLRNNGGIIYSFWGEVGERKSDVLLIHGWSGDYGNALVINALRPVFTLKGNLKVVSGDGTSESTAYRLGV